MSWWVGKSRQELEDEAHARARLKAEVRLGPPADWRAWTGDPAKARKVVVRRNTSGLKRGKR